VVASLVDLLEAARRAEERPVVEVKQREEHPVVKQRVALSVDHLVAKVDRAEEALVARPLVVRKVDRLVL
jgi:hypothetical protein